MPPCNHPLATFTTSLEVLQASCLDQVILGSNPGKCSTHLLQSRLDELALHVADGHVQLVDLEVSEDDL